MLHITNGDSAAARIRDLGFGGEVLPWRDVLHAGPVPAPATLDSLRPLRAHFLCGDNVSAVEVAADLEARDRRLGAGAAGDEVALWFEHDLYDQLQLLQILDWWADHRGGSRTARLTLAQSDDYLGLMGAERLRTLWERRVDVTHPQLQAARRAWAAFSAPDPQAIQGVADATAPVFRYVRPALMRHLEEFPATRTGLSRTERQILETLVVGSWPLKDLFTAAHHDREDPFFLGDSSFFDVLKELASGDNPLVNMDNDRAWLTDTGREVLGGHLDRIEVLGIDRWLGGVHLKGHRVPFRWNPAAHRIVTS